MSEYAPSGNPGMDAEIIARANTAIAERDERIARLEAGFAAAVRLVEFWHNFEFDRDEAAASAWMIYRDKSPEMEPVRRALLAETAVRE